jgi:hypothetical protein
MVGFGERNLVVNSKPSSAYLARRLDGSTLKPPLLEAVEATICLSVSAPTQTWPEPLPQSTSVAFAANGIIPCHIQLGHDGIAVWSRTSGRLLMTVKLTMSQSATFSTQVMLRRGVHSRELDKKRMKT